MDSCPKGHKKNQNLHIFLILLFGKTDLNMFKENCDWWEKFPEIKHQQRDCWTVSPQNPRSLRAEQYQNLVSGLADTFSIPPGIEEPVRRRVGNETTTASLVKCFHPEDECYSHSAFSDAFKSLLVFMGEIKIHQTTSMNFNHKTWMQMFQFIEDFPVGHYFPVAVSHWV